MHRMHAGGEHLKHHVHTRDGLIREAADRALPSDAQHKIHSVSHDTRRHQHVPNLACVFHHTITRTRPTNIHPFAPRPDQPRCASPLTALLAPFLGDGVAYSTTTHYLASLRARTATGSPAGCARTATGSPAGSPRPDIFLISSTCSRSRRRCAIAERKQSQAGAGRRRAARAMGLRLYVRVRCTVYGVCRLGGASAADRTHRLGSSTYARSSRGGAPALWSIM
jgi:hypothetical protein